MTVAGRTVLIAGATSAVRPRGRPRAARRGRRGSSRSAATRGASTRSAAELPGVLGERADLTDGDDVLELAMRVHARVGDVDGVVHLVGGWRGGGGILGQTEEDYRVLERSFTALRYVSRAFWDDLVASPAGRIAIVSSTTVDGADCGQRELHGGQGRERVLDAGARPGLREGRMPRPRPSRSACGRSRGSRTSSRHPSSGSGERMPRR